MTFDEVYQYTQSLHVLYVEDEADVREATRILLEKYFPRVDVAENAQEGLARYEAMAAKGHYDIVISNINLSRMSGLEMAEQIRQQYPEQYIIMMTAHNENNSFMDAVKLGINAYLIKPIVKKELSRVLFCAAKSIVNRYKVKEQQNKEKQQIKVNKRFQQALLKWSNVNFENTDHAIRELTELSVDALGISRVSFWLFNKKRNAIVCKDLFTLQDNSHTQGMSLSKKQFPTYFKALNEQRILVVDNAREDSRTAEFTSTYLEPLGIYSLLDVPIIQNNNFVGIICHEATQNMHHWTFQEQEFAMTLANNIALSLEIEKRYKVQNKLKIQKEKLHHQAHHDQLTGLPNRTLFLDRLEQAIKKNHRLNTKVALLFIDLDRFKEINDSLGHDAGDHVLKVLSRRLKKRIRDCDTLARLGGDEFTIILDNINDSEMVVDIIQKLLSSTNKAVQVNNQKLYVTLSIGISIFPDDGINVESLLKYADAAMYKAKDNGRNTYEFYTMEMTIKAVERVVMEANLRQAIGRNELYLNYQPQYDAHKEQLIGMEALIRWNNRDDGLIPPDKFIPFAEETGLIVGIDRWVMETSMKQFAQWYQEGLKPGTLSLNLAMKQLQQRDCIPFIKSLLEKYNFSENWLEFEITEGRIMKDPESAIKTLIEIKELGISLAIDDFGTGYSSLSYLKRLPIDTLKIDRAFVMDLPNDEEDEAISKAIIALGKSLNLNLIAEGVETVEQKEFLLAHGCQWIQGYYYSRPLPVNEMQEYLQNSGPESRP